MDVVVEAGCAQAHVECLAASVTVERMEFLDITPLLDAPRPTTAFVLRQGRTSMNAVSPDALIFEGGIAAAV